MSAIDHETMLAAARIVMAASGGGPTPPTPAPAQNPLAMISELKAMLPELKELLPLLDLLKTTSSKEDDESDIVDVEATPSKSNESEASEEVSADDPSLIPRLLEQLGEQVADLNMRQYQLGEALSDRLGDLDKRVSTMVELMQGAILSVPEAPVEPVEPIEQQNGEAV